MKTISVCHLCRTKQLDEHGACPHCDRKCTKRGCEICHEINEGQRKQLPRRWPFEPPPAA